MKKIFALILSAALVFPLAACSNTQQNDAPDPVSNEESAQLGKSAPTEFTKTKLPQIEENTGVSNTESVSSEPEETEGSNILIAYFTYGENAKLPNDVDASSSITSI